MSRQEDEPSAEKFSLQTLWSKIERPFYAVSSLLGLVVVVVQVIQWWQPSDSATIIWQTTVSDRYIPSANFPRAAFRADSAQTTDELPTNTVVREGVTTFWRDGGRPITVDQTRSPLQVKLPAGAKIIASSIVATTSHLSPNFTMTQKPNGLDITWKAFDPDDAIKIAFLFTGAPPDAPLVSDYVGPGISVTQSVYTWVKGIVVAAYFFGLMTLLVLWFNRVHAKHREKIFAEFRASDNPTDPESSTNSKIALGFTALTFAIMVSTFVLAWLVAAKVPLALATVTGL